MTCHVTRRAGRVCSTVVPIAVFLLLHACAEPDAAPLVRLDDLRFDTLTIVGVADGPPEQVFGRIRAVQAGFGESFFVLDNQANEVRWFDADGRFIAMVGGQGQGPGEFRSPADITSDGSRLYVLDSGNARISVFRHADRQLEHEQDISVPNAGGYFCLLSGRFYLHRAMDGHVLQAVDSTGARTASIGPIPPGEDDVGPFRTSVHEQKFIGPVHCDSDQSNIISMSRGVPLVRAFSETGTVVWTSQLTDFTPVSFRVTEARALMPTATPSEGWHIAQSLVSLGVARLLLQYEIWLDGPRPEDEDFNRLESRLLDAATGTELARSLTLPRIAATRGEVLYAFRNRPYPQVIVLRRR